jgi:hypothetical protein
LYGTGHDCPLANAQLDVAGEALRPDLERCYLITMRRFLALLIMFAVAISNGAGVAAAMCQHSDLVAHVAARQSADRDTADSAANEEFAAHSVSKQGVLGDTGASSPAGFILPPDSIDVPAIIGERAKFATEATAPLYGREPPPLQEPPLG